MINELAPVTLGLVLGVAVALMRPWTRLTVCAALATPLGVLATVVTGEFELSLGYLLVDVPLVAATAAVGAAVTRRARAAALQG